jgi:two-component system, OmpR family, response regulator
MRILIIEDNPIIAHSLRQHLKQHYAVDICNKGKEGLSKAETISYDTILLDLRLPDVSGEEICRSLRKRNIDTPIIVISGRSEVESKVKLLNIGADDYLTKPFNLHELRARINVAMRYMSNGCSAGVIIFDGLELDPGKRTVRRHSKPIKLRRKEFDLLEYLMRNAGRTLTRRMIMEHLWDANENLWANVVDVHIKYLRDKIDRPYGSSFIRTVHGIGYKFASSTAN